MSISHAVEGASCQLSRVADNESDERRVNESFDALFDACAFVAAKQGIEIKKPHGFAKDEWSGLDLIAQTSRVRTRKVLLQGEWWLRDNGPLLAWIAEDKRPVALLPISPKRYILHDLSRKEFIHVNGRVAARLDPTSVVFYRPLPKRSATAVEIIRAALAGCSQDVAMVIVLAAVGSLMSVATTVVAANIYNDVILTHRITLLTQFACILLALTMTNVMFEITKSIATLRVESKMDAYVQAGVMDHLLSLPAPFFRRFTTGDLTERTLGVNQIREALSGAATQSILSGIFSFSNVLLLFWYDRALALVALVMVSIAVACTVALSHAQVRYQRERLKIRGSIAGLVLQFIDGVAKLRVTGSEKRAFWIWAKRFGEYIRVSTQAGNVKNLQTAFNAGFSIVSLLAIFAYLGFVRNLDISVGNFVGFNIALANLSSAMLQMGMTATGLLSIGPIYERIRPILEARPEFDDAKSFPGTLHGNIILDRVSFRYAETGPYILKDVSLSVRAGEFVAIVGRSGSGKSTLLRLLMGFESPSAGAISYDDYDLSSTDIRAIRAQTGVVLQNGKTMAGSIFQNIVGSFNLTLDDAWEAARQAGFEGDIKKMPMQMNTVLTAGAETLSGGQRQQLLISRAIVRKPRILFFDEATSALDNRAQEVVSRSLQKLNATRVVIAHRLSTVMNADRIVVMENGQIIQSGAFEELISQAGPFAEFAKRQIA